MDSYQLNMAQGFVMSLESRRKWLRWFFVYVVMMCLVIAGTLYAVICESRGLMAQREALKQQERRIMAGHPGYNTVMDFQASQDRKLAICVQDLAAVRAFDSKDFPLEKILLGLADSLPAGIELSRVVFDAESGKLGIDIVLLNELKGSDQLTPPKLVALWEKEPHLLNIVSQISVGTSERVKLNGMQVICWRFSALVVGELK
jgi:hypothetical protein